MSLCWQGDGFPNLLKLSNLLNSLSETLSRLEQKKRPKNFIECTLRILCIFQFKRLPLFIRVYFQFLAVQTDTDGWKTSERQGSDQRAKAREGRGQESPGYRKRKTNESQRMQKVNEQFHCLQ